MCLPAAVGAAQYSTTVFGFTQLTKGWWIERGATIGTIDTGGNSYKVDGTSTQKENGFDATSWPPRAIFHGERPCSGR